MNMGVRCAVLHVFLFSCEVHGKAVLDYAGEENAGGRPARVSRVVRSESAQGLKANDIARPMPAGRCAEEPTMQPPPAADGGMAPAAGSTASGAGGTAVDGVVSPVGATAGTP